ncbi:MAG: methionyl-tRNA formyltransferase [Pseudomonadota bacterium]
MTKIVFAGTPDFAVPSLQALVDAQYDVVGVYSQPDRPAGRGRKLRLSPVKQRALELGLEIFQPLSLRSPESQATLSLLQPDLMVVAAYGLILPQAVLDLPTYGCINVHASLLPRWRGAAPVQRAILAGDEDTGVTIMQMDAGLDTGLMLRKTATNIGPQETAGEVTHRLSELGAKSLIIEIESILSGHSKGLEQCESEATYAAKIDKKEALLDFQKPVALLDRQVRGFNPWPTAYSFLGPDRVKIWEARARQSSVELMPGCLRVQEDGLFVAAADGELEILTLQPSGSRQMPATAFLNARDVQGLSFSRKPQ